MKKILGFILLVLVSIVCTIGAVLIAAAMLNFGLPMVAGVLFFCVLFWAIVEDYNIWWDNYISLIMLRGTLIMGWITLFILLGAQHMMP